MTFDAAWPMPLLRLFALLCSALLALPLQAGEITVSAAASLTQVLRELGPLFEAAHPATRVQFNFGASGALLTQIARGAPVDVFVSADQDSMDQAQKQRLLREGQRRDLLSNTLVLIVPGNASLVPKMLQDLTLPRYARIAIGLPASVPVGRYTRSALESAGLWAALEPRMVGAIHVRQALDYVARAEVDAAFVYATDAALMPDRVKVAMTVPTAQPIRYPISLLSAAPNPTEAARFIDFLFTPPAQAVFSRYGFGKP